MAIILSHLLAFYVVLVGPWLGRISFQKARRRIQSGDPLAKVRFYREIVVEQVVTTGVVLWLWLSGAISAQSLGLNTPRHWIWTAAVVTALCFYLLWSAAKLRPKAEKIRQRYKDSLAALFPDSNQDRRWFGAISIGAGISEELVYRGFLMYYLSANIPHVNVLEKVLLTSIIFGFGHLYQGWKGVLSTGIGGIVFALFYVLSGSLLPSAVLHAVTDYKLLLMLPPEEPQAVLAEGVA